MVKKSGQEEWLRKVVKKSGQEEWLRGAVKITSDQLLIGACWLSDLVIPTICSTQALFP